MNLVLGAKKGGRQAGEKTSTRSALLLRSSDRWWCWSATFLSSPGRVSIVWPSSPVLAQPKIHRIKYQSEAFPPPQSHPSRHSKTSLCELRQVETEMDSSNWMRDTKCQSSSTSCESSSSLTVDRFYLMNRQKCCEGEEKLLSINQMGIYLFFNTDSSSS